MTTDAWLLKLMGACDRALELSLRTTLTLLFSAPTSATFAARFTHGWPNTATRSTRLL
jgi:hypothetical protein